MIITGISKVRSKKSRQNDFRANPFAALQFHLRCSPQKEELFTNLLRFSDICLSKLLIIFLQPVVEMLCSSNHKTFLRMLCDNVGKHCWCWDKASNNIEFNLLFSCKGCDNFVINYDLPNYVFTVLLYSVQSSSIVWYRSH